MGEYIYRLILNCMKIVFCFVFVFWFSLFFPTPLSASHFYSHSILRLYSHDLPHALTNTCPLHLIVALCQTVAERETCNKHLQEQLTEANQANEAGRATQARISQSSDATSASDANQALHEELAKLRHEVPKHFLTEMMNLSEER